MKSLKRQRKLVGLTQFGLSCVTGISAARIASAETGRLRLTSDELELIKNAIKQRLAEVVETVEARV